MEQTLAEENRFEQLKKFCLLTFLGAGLLALGGAIRLPCYPVPMTLHTLALFTIALTQSPRQAAASTLCYFAFYPFGLLSKSGGYCIAFPIAAYLIAFLSDYTRPLFAILVGQGVIYILGFSWLAAFVGAKVALIQGVLIFIPSALLKAIVAVWIAERRR